MYNTFDFGITIERAMASLLLLFLIFNMYMAYRNYKVIKERERVKKMIFIKDETGNHIYSTLAINELISEMNKISSYFQMLLKVWIPVEQFYADFVDKIEKGEIPKELK